MLMKRTVQIQDRSTKKERISTTVKKKYMKLRDGELKCIRKQHYNEVDIQ
jgi:hypothetical protein